MLPKLCTLQDLEVHKCKSSLVDLKKHDHPYHRTFPDIFLHDLLTKTDYKMQKLRICLHHNNRCNVRQLYKDSGVNFIADNLFNFMHKRIINAPLLQEQPRHLRRFYATVFTEHISNNKSFE